MLQNLRVLRHPLTAGVEKDNTEIMKFSYKQSVVKALLLFVALVSAKAAQADNRL